MTVSPETTHRPKALIMGAANERSLAWAIAQHLHAAGMDLGFSHHGSEAVSKRIRPLAKSLNPDFIEPCDVTSDEDVRKLFSRVKEKWGRLDVLIHSVAFARPEDLDGALLDVPVDGFNIAMDASAYSLIRIARHAAPLMRDSGGSILTLTNSGSQRVIPGYHLMGLAKAALESAVRYLAYELGPSQIRVNAISAGPVKTFAAMGITGFNEMLKLAETRSPLRSGIDGNDVGALGAFLVSPASRHLTGACIPLDSGVHILGA